ncbi:hypothetical protein [Prosthecobacter sp.]|uniref:hypothetical protein n=1 Tax=Prosthecobacter sp. TaxID=1965333 RepID=UPI003783A9BA
MSFISTLESKFGRFAIPGLVQILVLFQLFVVIILTYMQPGGQLHFLQLLDLDPAAVWRGEVWRLVSHVLIPWRGLSLITALIGVLLMLTMGRTLDQAWGAFRVNLYILGWLIIADIGIMVFGWSIPSLYLYQSILFAFSTLVPEYEIQLYFVLPVKMKWVAFLAAGTTAFFVMRQPSLLLPVLLGHLNYLITFGPGFISERARMAQVAARRSRFESAKLPQGTFFHQCSICKKTEIDNPQLDFRVLDSGDEICSDCRAKQAAG